MGHQMNQNEIINKILELKANNGSKTEIQKLQQKLNNKANNKSSDE